MPRMSEAEKQKSHKRILDAAARLFRENGIETTSVADVMKAAGMTHGGFYRHFDSKEDLVAAAVHHAVDDVVSGMEEAVSPDEKMRARDAYIGQYLSAAHVRDLGRGCPLAALGAELARAGELPLKEGTAAAERMAGLLPQPEAENKSKGLALMALMMGAVTLARLAKHEGAADEALDAGRTGVALLQEKWPNL